MPSTHAGSLSSCDSPQKPKRAAHSSATSCFAGLTGFFLCLGAGGAFIEDGAGGPALGARVDVGCTGSGGGVEQAFFVRDGSGAGVGSRCWSGGLVGRTAFRGDDGGVTMLGVRRWLGTCDSVGVAL